MHLTKYGDPQNETILMIPGPLSTYKCLEGLSHLLEKDYYVVVVTLDGCEKGTIYKGAMQAAKDLLYKLKIEKITHVRMLLGVSSSCAIVMEIAKNAPDFSDFYFYESASFYHVVPFLRNMLETRLWMLVNEVKTTSYTAFKEALINDEIIKKILGPYGNKYDVLISDMYEVVQFVVKETISHFIADIVDYPVMKMDQAMMRRSVFFYGCSSLAYYVKDSLFDHYPFANFIEIQNSYYCMMLTLDPIRYKEYIDHILNKY
jgi:hypothetical protein